MSRSKVFLALGFILILGLLVAQSFSQDQPRQRGRGGGGGGPDAQGGQMDRPRQGMQGMRGQRDPEQMRRMMQERMMQRVRQNLGATEEEWTRIEPPLAKVMELSQQAEGPGMGMGGRMGMRGMNPRMARPGAPEGEEAPMPEPENKLDKARMELRQALDGEDKEAVQKKLDAFRAAREEAQKELAVAKKELKAAVTLPQEAELVLMGYLD